MRRSLTNGTFSVKYKGGINYNRIGRFCAFIVWICAAILMILKLAYGVVLFGIIDLDLIMLIIFALIMLTLSDRKADE
jgi:hypothetical protein